MISISSWGLAALSMLMPVMSFAGAASTVTCDISLQKIQNGPYSSVGNISYDMNSTMTPSASYVPIFPGLVVLCNYDIPPAQNLTCSFALPASSGIGWTSLNNLGVNVALGMNFELSEYEHTSKAGFTSSRIKCGLQ
jgi:hypothetical protein